MKASLRNISTFQRLFLSLCAFTLLLLGTSCNHVPDQLPTLHLTTIASGLVAPMGLETDAKGNVWVCETGTATNDGKVVVITPDGQMYDAIINLSSILNAVSGEPEGPAHLLLDNGKLYVLAGNYLYTIDVTHYTPGDTPINGATASYEDVGAFVLAYPFVNNAHDTHPYNLTKGADGDLYIADAGANAIIHRKSAGVYTVLAEVPGITNPLSFGPPVIESVPTGIMYDGHDFLVTNLLGFPFPTGYAMVDKVSPSGSVTVYQQGLTSLVDIAPGDPFFGHLVLQYGTFGAKGWEPNTGALVYTNGRAARPLSVKLNLPTGITQVNARTWYITSMGDGTLLKAAYY